MENYLRRSYYFFLIAFGLVNIISFTLVLMAISFSTGHTLSFWHFPMAIALALFVNFLASRFFLKGNPLRIFNQTSAIILGIIAISIPIAAYFYDISADGQMYHMEALYQYKTGWNPFRTLLPYDLNQALWLNHYGKGAEAPQAAIYALTGKIESGKATNIMLWVASFFLCLAFLFRINHFSLKKKLFISALFSFNPVTVYQLLCTYVDGQVASLLLCMLLICCFLFIETNRFFLFFLASVLVITLNIKFTTIIFAAIFSFGFLTILVINKKFAEARKVFIVCAASTILGIGLVGYFPYVTNTIDHNDPIYPGADVLQLEASKMYPRSFHHMGRMGKFFTSFFSHTKNFHLYFGPNPPKPEVPLKIPFTFNKTDIVNACKPFVVTLAGMGPFFSGLTILGLIFYVILARNLPDRKLFKNISLLLLVLLCSVFILSEVWFARYVPQFWFIPLIPAVLTEFINIKWINWLRTFFYVVTVISISFSFVSIPYNFYSTAQIDYTLAQLKASRDVIPVEFTYDESNRVRFYENNIPFKQQHLEGDSVVFMSNCGTKFIFPKNIPQIPKPFILKLSDEVRMKLKK